MSQPCVRCAGSALGNACTGASHPPQSSARCAGKFRPDQSNSLDVSILARKLLPQMLQTPWLVVLEQPLSQRWCAPAGGGGLRHLRRWRLDRCQPLARAALLLRHHGPLQQRKPAAVQCHLPHVWRRPAMQPGARWCAGWGPCRQASPVCGLHDHCTGANIAACSCARARPAAAAG